MTRAYVAAKPGWIIAGEYQDVMTGKRTDRPRYQAMLHHARRLHRERQRAAIVAVRLDRLGRNKAEYFSTAEELAKQGAVVHSIQDSGVLDETHASILAVFAAKEAQQIGERVGETRSGNVLSGWHYGKVPFGYHKRPATDAERAARSPGTVLEVDPVTCGVAAEVFNRIARGDSIQSVARWMKKLPEDRHGGRSWPAQCIAGLLRSPTYVARPAEGDDDVLARPRARWEPLVTDELWAQVQERISSHKRRPRQSTGRYLQTGFLRCPVCGQRMVAKPRYRTPTRADYRCTAWARGTNTPVLDCSYTVPASPSERQVLEQVGQVLGVLGEPKHWAALREAWDAQEAPPTDHRRRLARIESDLKQSTRRLADAATMLVDGQLDQLGYAALRDRELSRQTALKKERAELSKRQEPTQSLPPPDQVLAQAGG